MKILLIEDEAKLAAFVQKGLTAAGYLTDVAHAGSQGLEMAVAGAYDVIVLDLMLPGQNGFEVLKNLRDFQIHVPVLILSALSSPEYVVKGLDAGAVDYLKKPFDFQELLARLRVAARKGESPSGRKLVVGDTEMDLLRHEVHRNGEKISLTSREFSLLELLMRNAGRVLTKAHIFEKVWEADFDMGSNVIEVHIYQLRKKVDRDRHEPLIETVIGRGYRLRGNIQCL